VGDSGGRVSIAANHTPLHIRATGRQSRQICRMDKYGFPRTKPKQDRIQFGFQTGDIVKAIIPSGKYAGTQIGRVVVRSKPSFQLNGVDVHPKYLMLIHGADGYEYRKAEVASSPVPAPMCF
jgi:hypothetical protein